MATKEKRFSTATLFVIDSTSKSGVVTRKSTKQKQGF